MSDDSRRSCCNIYRSSSTAMSKGSTSLYSEHILTPSVYPTSLTAPFFRKIHQRSTRSTSRCQTVHQSLQCISPSLLLSFSPLLHHSPPLLLHFPLLILHSFPLFTFSLKSYLDNTKFKMYHDKIALQEGATLLRFRWYGTEMPRENKGAFDLLLQI